MKRSILLLIGFVVFPITAQANEFLNIRTDPVMILNAQYVNLELDFKISEYWSLGPLVKVDVYVPQYDAGFRATYFEDGTYQAGWMTQMELLYSKVEPANGYYSESDGSYCSDIVEEVSGDVMNICGFSTATEYQAVLNHGYFWRIGTFNIGYAMGAKLIVPDVKPENMRVDSSLNFSIGWLK